TVQKPEQARVKARYVNPGRQTNVA
ncbi:hypothetical protein Q604_UNBC13892G0001, partial [human gut metagenome]